MLSSPLDSEVFTLREAAVSRPENRASHNGLGFRTQPHTRCGCGPSGHSPAVMAIAEPQLRKGHVLQLTSQTG